MSKNCVLFERVKYFSELTDDQIMNEIEKGFNRLSLNLDIKQKNAWEGAIPNLRKVFEKINQDIIFVVEYKLPLSNERIDLVLLGRDNQGMAKAIIVELKGWREFNKKNDFIVVVNNEIHQHPELQLKNYIGKLNFSHSASKNFNFTGFVWLYNLKENLNEKTLKSISESATASTSESKFPLTFLSESYDDIANFIKKEIKSGITSQEANSFIDGEYIQTTRLLETIKDKFHELKNSALDILCERGFAPSKEQTEILFKVLDELKSEKRKCFLIHGEPGSGKTYLAILLLLEILKKMSCKTNTNQNIAVLGYRNNRLINAVRDIFKTKESGLDTLIKFYSTGRNNGLAEGNPNNPHFKAVIYDESQRMTKKNIEIAMQRGDITVFFFDENQILNAEEEGYLENFIDVAKRLNIPYEELKLCGIYRVRGGRYYHNFIERLLQGNPCCIKHSSEYEFMVFDKITDMLDKLGEKVRNSHKIALVASFTESPGDKHDQNSTSSENKSNKNLRVGYPLCSNFDIYKGIVYNKKPLEILWLMDERIEYPQFWIECKSNNMTHCASIYGCQGFEADYVGVIWGRDFVWRNKQWEVGSNCEDTIGKPSLKQLMKKASQNPDARKTALRLLINRYRIFLTRGILGTYIFCEDEETRKFLKNLVVNPLTEN